MNHKLITAKWITKSQINSQQNQSQINSQQNETNQLSKMEHKLTHSKRNHKLTHSKRNHILTHSKMNHKLTHSKMNHKLTHSKAQELVGQLDLLKSWHTDVHRPCTDHLVEVDGVVTAERQHGVDNTVLFRHLNDDKLPGQLGQGGWVPLWTVASHPEWLQTVSKVMSLAARTQTARTQWHDSKVMLQTARTQRHDSKVML